MSHPNLLVLMDDQHSRQMSGCYGHPLVETPNLDRLADRGVRFTNAYTNSPLCVPARASLATGRYVHETACWDNAIAYDGRMPSWGHRLQAAGIPCTSIGKLHYRYESDPTGFDEQVIPMHIADGVGDLMGCIRPDLPVRHQCRKYAEEVGPGETAYTRYDRDIADRAGRWLRGRAGKPADRPWVLFVSFIAPHFPLVVPQPYFERYPLDRIDMPKPADIDYQSAHPWWKGFCNSNIFDRYFRDDEHRKTAIACYFGLCTFIDEQIGKVLNALDETGLTDETRVLFFSDHGDNLGARGIWGKSTMHEESAGIPMLLAGPDVPANKTVATPVSLVDVFPTVLETAGVGTNPEDAELPGESLAALGCRVDDPQRLVFSEYHGAASISGSFMLRAGPFKYVHYTGCPPELFDLLRDPDELANLVDDPAHAPILAEFEAKLRTIVDPETVDRRAKADQAAHIERHGGIEKILKLGGLHGTPVPGGGSTRVNP